MIKYRILITMIFLKSALGAEIPIAEDFILPIRIDCKITQEWGSNNSRIVGVDREPKKHTGVDLFAPAGTLIYAACDGYVRVAQKWHNCPDWDYLIIVESIIDDEENFCFLYGNVAPLVKPGSLVKMNQLLGAIPEFYYGEEHLHFSVYRGSCIDNTIPNWAALYVSTNSWPGNYLNPSELVFQPELPNYNWIFNNVRQDFSYANIPIKDIEIFRLERSQTAFYLIVNITFQYQDRNLIRQHEFWYSYEEDDENWKLVGPYNLSLGDALRNDYYTPYIQETDFPLTRTMKSFKNWLITIKTSEGLKESDLNAPKTIDLQVDEKNKQKNMPSLHYVNDFNTGWCYPLNDLFDAKGNSYKPTENITFGFMSYNKLDYPYHYAQDITRNNFANVSYKEGDPVFAMADGNIIRIAQIPGYGSDKCNTMIVEYKYCNNGEIYPVYVLYGHVKNIKSAPECKLGDEENIVQIPVSQFEKIAELNDPGEKWDHVYHLHLCVMPDLLPHEWYKGYNTSQNPNGRVKAFDCRNNKNGLEWCKDWIDNNGVQNEIVNSDVVFFNEYSPAK